MSELLKSSTPIARKQHACRTCNRTAVSPGERYSRETYVGDGRVYDWVQCLACQALAQRVWDWAIDAEDGIGQEEYAEWAQEHREHPEYGRDARAYLERLTPESEGSVNA